MAVSFAATSYSSAGEMDLFCSDSSTVVSYSSAGEMDLFCSDSSTVVSYSSAGEMDLFCSDSSTVVSYSSLLVKWICSVLIAVQLFHIALCW